MSFKSYDVRSRFVKCEANSKQLQQKHRTEPLPVQKQARKHCETDHFDAFEL